MRQLRITLRLAALASALTIANGATALAAGSLTNSLTGFSGVSSDAGFQATMASAGFEFSSIDGLAEDFSNDPTISFDANGANFGTLYAGDGGRNYMRTIDNYYQDSFVAEVTIVVDTLGTDVAFFGLGSGDIDQWGTPDFAGRPTVFMTPENGSLKANAADGISGDWIAPDGAPTGDWSTAPAPGLVGANAGTHRLRMTFDAAAKTWTGSVDVDYAGGAFVADASTPTYNLTNLFDDGGFVANGWPTLPSKIYFGGDDGAIFKDFKVTVGSAPVEDANFNDDSIVDGKDYLIWQRGFGTGTDNSTGDANGSGSVDGDDLAIWRAQYGNTVAISAVPEPTSAVLAVGALVALRRRRS